MELTTFNLLSGDTLAPPLLLPALLLPSHFFRYSACRNRRCSHEGIHHLVVFPSLGRSSGERDEASLVSGETQRCRFLQPNVRHCIHDCRVDECRPSGDQQLGKRRRVRRTGFVFRGKNCSVTRDPIPAIKLPKMVLRFKIHSGICKVFL